MSNLMGPEIWLADRDLFQFHCQDAARGNRWTFCVPGSALRDLQPDAGVNLQDAFDLFRGKICAVAISLMSFADPHAQHMISAEDIRRAV